MQLSVGSENAAADLAVSAIFPLAKDRLNRIAEGRMHPHSSAEDKKRAAKNE